MPKKCLIKDCKSGYASHIKKTGEKVSLYSFPKDPEKRRQWIRVLPNKIEGGIIKNNQRVCAKHFVNIRWKNCENGSLVPDEPPNCFPNSVPKSCCGTKNAYQQPRKTSMATAKARAVDVDEMSTFKALDALSFSTFHLTLEEKVIDSGIGSLAWGKDENSFIVLSKNRNGPVHEFAAHFCFEDVTGGTIKKLNYEAYLGLRRFKHPSLTDVKGWSGFDALLHCLTLEADKGKDGEGPKDPSNSKFEFLEKQITLMNTPKNSRLYEMEDFLRGFKWYTMSRPLYKQISKIMQLPSVSTLQNLTRVAKNMEDTLLFTAIFQKQDERSRGCILIVDEVYVKASLTYNGGVMFGYAADKPDIEKKLATTLLCIMAKCFFTNKTFLVKMIPCHALKSEFLYQCVANSITQLEECGGRVHGLIADNNRVNQKCFKEFFTPFECDKPWIVQSPVTNNRPFFLLYDPVHLIKSLRNNWHTARNQAMKFIDTDGQEKLAHWRDLKILFEHESPHLLKQSKLTKASVNPTNIEKQKVSLALNVFSDKTMAALLNSSVRSANPSMEPTAQYIGMVVQLWKLLNCKSVHEKKRNNDPDRIVVDNGEDGDKAQALLRQWARRAEYMKRARGERFRESSLSTDTANALRWTCNCLADLSTHLLTTDTSDRHDFVCLGFYQQDDLEHHFAHFRMAAGCNFYMSVSEVFTTHSMDKAMLMLEFCNREDVDMTQNCHSCPLCSRPLTEGELLFMDDGIEEVNDISRDDKLSLFYIAGYVASKHPEYAGKEEDFSESDCDYLQCLDRGKLSFPSVSLYRLTLLSYAFYSYTTENLCRTRLSKIISSFPAIFHLDMDINGQPLARISNILFKRFAEFNNRDNFGGNKAAVVKLSSKSTSRQ